MPVVRALFLLITLAAVLLAAVTTGGRVAVALLPRYEGELNVLLRSRGVELGGLSGTWHWLDPIIRIDSVRFVGGRASGVTLQVDLLESALRGALIARHLSVQHVDLAPVEDAAGHWRIGMATAGQSAAPASLEPLLRYSDVLQFPDVRARFVASGAGPGDAPLGELHASVDVRNVWWDHSGALTLQVERGGRGSISLRYAIREGILGNPSHGRIALRSDPLTIDPAFGIALGGAGMVVDTLSGDWSFGAGASTGQLHLAARGIELPTGRLERVELAARGAMERFGFRWTLLFDRLRVEVADGGVDLDGATIALTHGLDAARLEATLPPLDAAAFNRVAVAAVGPTHRIGAWLAGLDPHGRVEHAVASIDLTHRQVDYAATATAVTLENYKGVPYVRNGAAVVAGTEHAVDIRTNDRDVTLGFFEFYDQAFHFDALSGDLLLWFRPGYFAMSGSNLQATTGSTRAAGEFEIGRPANPLEQRVFAAARLNDIDGRAALAYVPKRLAVYRWLDDAVQGGHVEVADLLYHGHFRELPGLPMRQLELSLAVRDAAVEFHPDWPQLDAGEAHVTMTGGALHGEISDGHLAGIGIAKASLAVPRTLDRVDVVGNGSGDASGFRTLLDRSPLAGWLDFVKPTWTFAGPFGYTARLGIPFSPEAGSPKVALNLDLRGVDLGLGDIQLPIDGMRGALSYRYPLDVEAKRIDAVVFGNPAQLSAASTDGEVRIAFSARADARALSDWRRLPNPDLVTGPVDFSGDLRIRPGGTAPAQLALHTDFVGTTLDLPTPLGKPAGQPLPTSLSLSFETDRELLDIRVGDVLAGWLRFDANGLRAGQLGIGVLPGPPSQSLDRIELTGSLGELDLSQWFGTQTLASQPSFAWAVNDLHVARARYRSVAFDDLVANGSSEGTSWQMAIAGPDIAGDVKVTPGQAVQLTVHRLTLPARQSGAGGDPLAAIDPRAIGNFDIVVDHIALGDSDYGSWRWQTRSDPNGVAVDNLVADIKGLHIDSPSGTRWVDNGQASSGSSTKTRTLFKGTVKAENLATVLPQWDYAPTVETSAAQLDANLRWDGSPLNFALPRVDGRMQIHATKGRFVDVDEGSGTGAVRIFSLLNFTAIAKRMAFDFSDVFGKGISFDKVTATAEANHGTITLVEPMVIEGTGGSFSINGTVDFMTGKLDNEMLVTLPVSSSLPWYAAYLGFVNPLAAGAVLVGERIFRSQIEKFSTAKYKVTGTLQDPKVTFVQVFPKALEGTIPASAQNASEAAAPSGQKPAASATPPNAKPPTETKPRKDKDA